MLISRLIEGPGPAGIRIRVPCFQSDDRTGQSLKDVGILPKRNAFTIGTRIVDIESLARRFAPFPRGGGRCARIRVRHAGWPIVVVRGWRVDGSSLTSGHEPSINSRRNWRFIYIKSGADTASRCATRADPTNCESE